jgi:putative transposase
MDVPMKKRTIAAQAAVRGRLPELPQELLDELVGGIRGQTELTRVFRTV